MLLHPVDLVIIVIYLTSCVIAGVWMKRYVRGVEDFAVAGREMDLNLGVASLAATEVGIVTVMYAAQMGFEHGLAGAAPGVFGCLAMLLVGLTGFVIVPLRKAGVITIPELFEKKFGKRVRWLAGVVVILGGLLNMGIFLRMGGEFLSRAIGLNPNETISLLGMELGLLEVAMTALLGLILLYTVLGGMVSVLVTDYLQFLVMGMGIVAVSVLVIYHTGWSNLINGLERAHEEEVAIAAQPAPGDVDAQAKVPEPVTMKDPFNPAKSKGWGWVIWQALLQIAIMTTWQTTIARVLAARDVATAKRVYVRTSFYFVGRFGLPGLWGAAAFLYFANLGALPPGTDSLTALPEYLRVVLPVGVIGIVFAAMLAAEMSTDSGYMLTWATVIYNDIISPCLRRPLPERLRLTVVRSLVLAIGAFLVFYGLWYELPGGAWDYLAVTGNIYMASLFTLLVGALYWKGSNSWGATAAIILGASGPLAFLVLNYLARKEFVPKDWELSPELAGGLSFLMAFGGMFFGSLLAKALGRGYVPAAATEEAR